MQKQLGVAGVGIGIAGPGAHRARAAPRRRSVRVEAAVEVGDKAPDFTLPDQVHPLNLTGAEPEQMHALHVIDLTLASSSATVVKFSARGPH